MGEKKYFNLFLLFSKLSCVCLPFTELYQKSVDKGEWMKQYVEGQSPRSQDWEGQTMDLSEGVSENKQNKQHNYNKEP